MALPRVRRLKGLLAGQLLFGPEPAAPGGLQSKSTATVYRNRTS
jgi:hypothetical protein